MTTFIAAALATWRLTRMIVSERGPYDLLGRFRFWAGVRYDMYSQPKGTTELSKMIVCPYCLSIWIGALIAIVTGSRKVWAVLTNGLAYSAVAVLITHWLENEALKRAIGRG